MLTLFVDAYWISPYAFSAFVALREKRLPFEARTLDLFKREHHALAYRDGSVTGRVPALHDGDELPASGEARAPRGASFWLAESSAIVEYLDEKYPAPAHPAMLPAGLEERARARMVMAWIRSDLMALREERPTSSMFYQPAAEPLSAAGQEAADRLVRVASSLVPDGATSLFGGFTIADADLAFMLHRLILNRHAVPPKLAAFATAVWGRPSVREWVVRERPPYVPY